MEKLISMTAYIDYLQTGGVTEEIMDECSTMDLMIVGESKYSKGVNYKEFLIKPLELGFFVPCDLEGNVLEKPEKPKHEDNNSMLHYHDDIDVYQEALDRVLFEGLEVYNPYSRDVDELNETILIKKISEKSTLLDCVNGMFDFETIEDLVELGLTLTPSSNKQLK